MNNTDIREKAEALREKGLALCSTDKLKALEHFLQSIEVDNTFVNGYNSIARVLVDLEEPEKALEYIEKALELSGNKKEDDHFVRYKGIMWKYYVI